MKILVTGGSGVIGTKLVQYFRNWGHDVDFIYFKNETSMPNGHYLDITEKNSAVKLISKINPDIVIHSMALTNVDLCETQKDLAEKINVDGTNEVIQGCKISKSKLVYISTSFVFNGKKENYSENDSTGTSTYYGFTKLAGENLVENSNLSYLILRTDQPYCWIEKWQHTNSVLRVLDTLKSENTLKEIIDWYNTPTYVPDFVNATKKLIDQNLTGRFHVVGSDFVNRYEWALMVAEIFGLNKNKIKPINSEELGLPVKRSNVNLNNQKLFEKTGIKMLGIREGLEQMLKDKQKFN